jgi:soluble lytic murein transglycosylase-like protein
VSDFHVSNSQSVAVKPRGFARMLKFGGMCAVAAFMLQNAAFNPQRQSFVHHPILVRLIGDPVPALPSAYDEESTLSSSQLLARWDGTITEASRRFHVPKAWIRAVMARESGGRTMLGEDKPIVSSAGAVGLMQVLPQTYSEMAQQHRLGSNPFDAHDNIMAGAAYLHWLHQRYGYPAMFAAYNAGPGRLQDHLEHGARLPAETRAYIAGITRGLDGRRGVGDLELVRLTRPDGAAVKIDPAKVTAIRAPMPGEYDASVGAVLTLGHRQQQGIRENVQIATAAIRADGGLI